MLNRARTVLAAFAPFLAALASTVPTQATAGSRRFEITYSATADPGPITGRLILILTTRDSPEPRLTVSPLGPAIFGIDVHQLEPGESVTVDDAAIGYPSHSLADLPRGDYFAQAVIHRYTQVHRADGHTLWVHMNDGLMTSFNVAPGNLYSDVQLVHIGDGDGDAGPDAGQPIRIEVTHVIPDAEQPADTEWVKHVRFQSPRLTEFWGHPVFINATVLLPRGYDDHPEERYPTVFTMCHRVPFSFSPDPASARGRRGPDPVTGVENGFEFYQSWTADDFPRVIAVSFQQQTPFFPDSYSVNSANNGPYGDVIVEEVIPWLESQFRMIREPFARILEGASTGGWQALALQLKHPDFFGGAWVLQPDPIDFTRYGLVNIYEDANAFEVRTGAFTKTERPMRRTVDGQVLWTMRDLSRFEAVLGSHGRSGFQLMGWEAVYGPVGEDGYPKPLWDKMTGEIDHEVAASMRGGGYDLLDFAKRNWTDLAPKVRGKIHIFCGDMDDFYLNLAVYRFEEFIRSAQGGDGAATLTYGRPRKGHSWHAATWAQMVRDMAAQVARSAPRD